LIDVYSQANDHVTIYDSPLHENRAFILNGNVYTQLLHNFDSLLNSQRIHKVRPLIAPLRKLLGTQPLDPMITLPLLALAILHYQQEILDEGPTEQAYNEVSKHHAMAGVELGCITAAVDIRGDDTVEISPSNYNAQRDTPLVDAWRG